MKLAQTLWYFRLILAILVIFGSLSLQVGRFDVLGAVSACSASVSSSALTVSSSTSLTFSVTDNDGANGVSWVRINAPSGDFEITGGSASGWGADFSASDITFTGGNFDPGESVSFSVNITTGSSEVGTSAFLVEVSDDNGGNGSTTCSGSTSVSITSLSISSITISDISDSAVKINWTTSRATTGTVSYGPTSGYGSSKSDTNSSVSHSVEIGSLSANTTYHFNISGTDGTTNVSSGDSTFATAKAGTTITTTVTVTNTNTNTETKLVKDTTAPTVSITTTFEKPFDTAPRIEGTASDNSGISKIEYSTDGGVNWLPADEVEKLFSTKTKFSFLPFISDDGDYKISARAYDTTGNVASSKTFTLVIDRLPPQVGSSLVNIGPLVLLPKENGTTYLLANLDYKITLSSVGGTTDINLKTKGKGNSKDFSLVKNPETGLWVGNLKFERTDEYAMVAVSKDGGGNITERQIGNFVVMPSGSVLASDKKSITNLQITTYVFEVSQQKYVVWDATYFVQNNPLKTDSDGKFSLVLPKGKYYFTIKAEGISTQKSEIFDIFQTTFVNPQILLDESSAISLGPFRFPIPAFFQKKVKVIFGQEDVVSSVELNRELPTVKLLRGSEEVSTLDFRSKPTIITVISNWSGFDSNQLNVLDEAAGQNPTINFVPVLSQEKSSLAQILGKKLHISLPIYADPDGLLTEPLGINSLPAHYFVSRNGTIKKAIYGILSKEELLSNIIN